MDEFIDGWMDGCFVGVLLKDLIFKTTLRLILSQNFYQDLTKIILMTRLPFDSFMDFRSVVVTSNAFIS